MWRCLVAVAHLQSVCLFFFFFVLLEYVFGLFLVMYMCVGGNFNLFLERRRDLFLVVSPSCWGLTLWSLKGLTIAELAEVRWAEVARRRRRPDCGASNVTAAGTVDGKIGSSQIPGGWPISESSLNGNFPRSESRGLSRPVAGPYITRCGLIDRGTYQRLPGALTSGTLTALMWTGNR